MKAGNESKVAPLHLTLACAAAAAFGVMACNGAISEGGGNPGNGSMSGGAGSTGSGSGLGGATPNPPVGGGGTIGGGGTGVVGPLDSGRIDIHRLNNLEYDNTIRDLLGVDGMAQKTFQPDEEGEFDNDADAFTMNDARYEQYFNSAFTIGDTVFADTTPTGLRQTYVYGLVTPACTPSATSTDCTTKIITAFGARAWRRPLTTQEVSGLVTVATNAISQQMVTADDSIKQVVQTMLASPQFLYRIEFDPNPNTTTPHSLDPYELASRLSYLGWSSMPDKHMFDLAASQQILGNPVLLMEVDRMLADAKGANFTNSFAGQWLGGRDMLAHQVEPTAFKNFDEPLRQAMVQEELMYFNEFLIGKLPMTQFFTTQENFVNTRLATHYGFPAVAPTAGYQKVMNGSPNRVGFMGLGSFLTFTSYSYRTAPTLRGKWVLLNLLCQTIPAPPANVPKLDSTTAATDPSAQAEDVRMRLTAHRQAADCAACHALLDPIGLGLENFDAIGAYRQKYSATSATNIDSSGMLPSGEMFSSLSQLAMILSSGVHGQQLTDCASHKMMTYALSRSLTASDTPYLNQVRTAWTGQGYGLRDLMKDIVTNDTFKFRRGEAP
jgi:hypothetical protein